MKSLIKIGLVLVLGFVGCTNSSKQDNPNNEGLSSKADTLAMATPDEVGMSKEKIAEAHNLFINAVKENKVLGYQIPYSLLRHL